MLPVASSLKQPVMAGQTASSFVHTEPAKLVGKQKKEATDLASAVLVYNHEQKP
jgi:hypothetical protein